MTHGRATGLEKIAIGELVEDDHLYPRSEVDGSTVEQFREALRAGAKFPPIRVCSKTYRIIDGFHRKTAYERERATHILCSLEDVEDDRDLFRRAAQANASHGRRYSVDDYATAVRLAKRLGLTREQISSDLFLPLERVEKLERLSTGRGHAPLERNVPKAGGKPSKLIEKSMDAIALIAAAGTLERALAGGHVDGRSEELHERLVALEAALRQHLERVEQARAEKPQPHPVYTRLYPPDERDVKAA